MMHQVAEYGMASHWAYTENKRMKNGDGCLELYKTPWLSSIKEWQNDRISSRDFVDSVRRELLGKRVFVFLRNGKILNLARGATAIDAAFQIHTEIGLTMHGVEINGKPVPLSYELRNGDVVSILTGKGKPATDWMRYAKSRSTRSKLRAYFRTRQKESLREAGKLLIMDYLWMHGPLIEKESFLQNEFKVPTLNVEDLQSFLTKTSFDELDDLLIALGKDHDRNMLHKIVSQMFEVPRKLLIEAEETRNHRYGPGAISTNALKLQDTPRNSTSQHSDVEHNDDIVSEQKSDAADSTRTHSATYTVDSLLSRIVAPLEYADPEHLCKVCLPVHGDAIVGTRPSDQDPSSTMPTVHRMGCPHAQQAINRAWADQRVPALESSEANGTKTLSHLDSFTFGTSSPKVDSFTLRYRKWTDGSRREQETHERLVKLEWSDFDENNTLFLSEIVVVAEDRKLLLTDCSAVVSEAVEIVKTGSLTTNEHATLVFLVQVTGLDCIQKLMDKIGNIRSVMSVERSFGSDLLQGTKEDSLFNTCTQSYPC
jgi:(p)ppGpp synthase/HD superfamily hydrolase